MTTRCVLFIAMSLVVSLARGAEPASPPVPAAKPLDRFQQLARTNPFRPIGLAAKANQGEPGGETAPGEPGAEGTAKSPPGGATVAVDSLEALKRTLVVTAIVSTDTATYAVIGGKRYAVGDEIAPRVKIVGIHSTGITLATTDGMANP
jgi:hypothetical protein